MGGRRLQATQEELIVKDVLQRILDTMKTMNFDIVQRNGQRISSLNEWVGAAPGNDCEVFVGKIPKDCFEDELLPILELAGKVYEIRLMMDFSGYNRGFAFVKYTDPKFVMNAVDKLNNHKVRPGYNLGVVKALNNCKLFVGGLPNDSTTYEIKEVVTHLTEGVVSVHTFFNTSTRKTLNLYNLNAIIEYKNHLLAAMARKMLIPENVKMWGRKIFVDWATGGHIRDHKQVSQTITPSYDFYHGSPPSYERKALKNYDREDESLRCDSRSLAVPLRDGSKYTPESSEHSLQLKYLLNTMDSRNGSSAHKEPQQNDRIWDPIYIQAWSKYLQNMSLFSYCSPPPPLHRTTETGPRPTSHAADAHLLYGKLAEMRGPPQNYHRSPIKGLTENTADKRLYSFPKHLSADADDHFPPSFHSLPPPLPTNLHYLPTHDICYVTPNPQKDVPQSFSRPSPQYSSKFGPQDVCSNRSVPSGGLNKGFLPDNQPAATPHHGAIRPIPNGRDTHLKGSLYTQLMVDVCNHDTSSYGGDSLPLSRRQDVCYRQVDREAYKSSPVKQPYYGNAPVIPPFSTAEIPQLPESRDANHTNLLKRLTTAQQSEYNSRILKYMEPFSPTSSRGELHDSGIYSLKQGEGSFSGSDADDSSRTDNVLMTTDCYHRPGSCPHSSGLVPSMLMKNAGTDDKLKHWGCQKKEMVDSNYGFFNRAPGAPI